ncbi:hypothetical protein OsJ_32250 [Oryza sativa Japonica Group]|uniref:Uncharacterized protein n=3 Tax=Oryza TaxID=4527 RepID=A3C6R4_ORYSJ|nr:hypothetical protein [Oryza sativa Japonica Group]ABB47922.2 hypothetical protein LOC_Os10g38790 [Oryza sativa Japonica Group]EAZ16777.1 hypothetical protein OsJ_32250 [Oryza sativa Japonica Group]
MAMRSLLLTSFFREERAEAIRLQTAAATYHNLDSSNCKRTLTSHLGLGHDREFATNKRSLLIGPYRMATKMKRALYHLFHPQLFQHRERKAVEGAAGEVEARREEVDTEDDATGEVEAGLAEADAEDGAARGIEDEGEKKGHWNGHARGN